MSLSKTLRPADTLILPPHTIRRYGGEALADTFFPPDDIASRRFVSIS